jgi:hypothetical protein
MKRFLFAAVPLASLLLAGTNAIAAAADIQSEINAAYPKAETLYLDLHRHPELSMHEQRTAATLAAVLRELHFEVTEHVGGTGVVGVLKNGQGPVVLLRTELDALPDCPSQVPRKPRMPPDTKSPSCTPAVMTRTWPPGVPPRTSWHRRAIAGAERSFS